VSRATKIEWTRGDDGTAGATWNPLTGCTKVSPGCDNCYAETFAERWRGVPGHPYEQGFDLRPWPERLRLPFRWRKPRRRFVNSMSDLFHNGVDSRFIQQLFAVMWATPQHTDQVLTKRPGRMASLMGSYRWWFGVLAALDELLAELPWLTDQEHDERFNRRLRVQLPDGRARSATCGWGPRSSWTSMRGGRIGCERQSGDPFCLAGAVAGRAAESGPVGSGLGHRRRGARAARGRCTRGGPVTCATAVSS